MEPCEGETLVVTVFEIRKSEVILLSSSILGSMHAFCVSIFLANVLWG